MFIIFFKLGSLFAQTLKKNDFETSKNIKVRTIKIKQLISNRYSKDSIVVDYIVDSNLVKNGIVEYFNPHNGTKRTLLKGFYKNGILSDSIQVFNPEGKLKAKGYLESNLVNNLSSHNFPFFNGEEILCINCITNGEWVSYWLNTEKLTPFQIANYNKGKLNGQFKEYYNNGKLRSIFLYVNNVKNGPFVEYNLNGTKKTEGYFKENKLEDTLYEYENDGKMLISFYKQNELLFLESRNQITNKIISKTYWNLNRDIDSSFSYYPTGKLKYIKKIGSKKGFEKAFFEDGKLELSRNFKGIYLVGKDLSFYRNGQQKSYYFRDTLSDLQGKSFEWDSLGRITLEENYKDGKLNGEQKIYEKGKLIELNNYKNNQLDGYRYFYDDLGEVFEKELFKEGEFVKSIILKNRLDGKDSSYILLNNNRQNIIGGISSEENIFKEELNLLDLNKQFLNNNCNLLPHSFLVLDSLQKHFNNFVNSKDGLSLKNNIKPISFTCVINNSHFNERNIFNNNIKLFSTKLIDFKIKTDLKTKQKQALSKFLQNLKLYYSDYTIWYNLLEVTYDFEII